MEAPEHAENARVAVGRLRGEEREQRHRVVVEPMREPSCPTGEGTDDELEPGRVPERGCGAAGALEDGEGGLRLVAVPRARQAVGRDETPCTRGVGVFPVMAAEPEWEVLERRRAKRPLALEQAGETGAIEVGRFSAHAYPAAAGFIEGKYRRATRAASACFHGGIAYATAIELQFKTIDPLST